LVASVAGKVIKLKRGAAMDLEELQGKLEGLSEAQLKLLVQVAWEKLVVEQQELVAKLAGAMVRENNKSRGE